MKKTFIVGRFLVLIPLLMMGFQNCANKTAFSFLPSSEDAAGAPQTITEELTVGRDHPNPPLDLFFVVDNSASMAGHQIDLSAAFATIFQNNQANLSNFDTRIYIFSTASTVNGNMASLVPSRAPSSISMAPSTSSISDLITTPGAIFSLWANSTGTFGQSGYSAQYNPSPVLAPDASGVVTSSLFIPRKGIQSDAAYQASTTQLTSLFQRRLAYLNPSNYLNTASQASVQQSTDVSSGLCSMARIMRHAKDQALIASGDTSAFVLVSDDNDRLNVRNANGNQCLEATFNNAEVVDGSCGHHQTDFSYNTTSTITYKSTSKFTYHAATKIPFTYNPGTESCTYKYVSGYPYSATYTRIRTAVTYMRCSQVADGTCISPSPATVTVDGSYVGSGGTCTSSNMAGVNGAISLAAPGTAYTCASNDLAGQTLSGTDTASDGTNCSTSLLTSIGADTTKSNVVCTINASAPVYTGTLTASAQSQGSCSSFCTTHSQFAGCQLLKTTIDKNSGTISFNADAVTCNSPCPDQNQCGNGTVADGLTAKYGNTSVCGTPSTVLGSLSLSGVTATGAGHACSDSISGLTVRNSAGTAICIGKSDMNSCIQSVQASPALASSCATNGVGTATMSSPSVNVSCTTACSASGGLCDSTLDSNVAAFLTRTQNGYCSSSTQAGAKKLSLKFKESAATTSSCSTKCSDTISGSCDGNGFGATNGASVGDYVSQSLAGTACAVSRSSYGVSDTPVSTILATNVNSQCVTGASPVFITSRSAYVTSTPSFVAGDVNHAPLDLQEYIQAQSKSIFGGINKPTIAAITQLPGDNLPGTDVGTDYVALTGPNFFDSNQVSSIKGDYSVALSQISNFIATSAQNSFALVVPSGSLMLSVSVQRAGEAEWTQLPSSEWTFAGTTLSIDSAVALQIGDKLQYRYQ